jgi:hypothetical protein
MKMKMQEIGNLIRSCSCNMRQARDRRAWVN